MAAYAALVSVMNIIHDLQHHRSPPISIDTQQLQSLSQILTSLLEFLEAYKSPVADADDEADPLEMRIVDAAYAAEDVIESHIVDMIHLTRTNHQQISCFSNCFLAPKKPENEDDEQTKSIKFYQDLQRVIEEMDLIKQMAMQIDTEKPVAIYDHNVSSSVAPFRSFSSSSAMVCSDAVLLGIMEKLSGGGLDCQVIPIVGMGGIDPPSDEDDDVVIMENLHILKGVKNLKCCEEVVKRIPNIKKLEIYYRGQLKGTKHDDSYCVSNIKSLCKLESLFVELYDPKYRDAPYLYKLSFPHSLKRLTLRMLKKKFEWEEVLEKIGSLPHLEKLKLWFGWFRTGEWEIVEGQFPKLKYLGLIGCISLEQLTVEGSSVLPRLEKLILSSKPLLKEIPREIGHIPTLQKVELRWCSESAVRSAKEMVEEQVELQGEPLPFHVIIK